MFTGKTTLDQQVAELIAGQRALTPLDLERAQEIVALVRQNQTASWTSTLNIWISRFKDSQQALRDVEDERDELISAVQKIAGVSVSGSVPDEV